MSIYPKAKSVKGKITVEGDKIEIAHDEQQWVFEGNTMTASYEGAWVDTWARVQINANGSGFLISKKAKPVDLYDQRAFFVRSARYLR